MVYFIAAPGRVKIGYTTNIVRRFRNLSTASPDQIRFIGAVEGDRALERALHATLNAFRTNGEWFADTPEVQEVIHRVIAGYPAAEFLAANQKRIVSPLVVWASDALRGLANPKYGEKHKTLIQRAADLAGLSYWRAFDIWYRKARRLEISEREAIVAAMGGGQ